MNAPRRGRLAAVALAVLTVGALGARWYDGATVHRGGPLDQEGSMSTGTNIAPGTEIAVAPFQLLNASRETAVLESARPLGTPSGLTLRRVYVMGKERPTSIAGGVTELSDQTVFPRALLKPVEGFRATPERPSDAVAGTNLVFVFKVNGLGNHRIEGAVITYRVGGKRYRRVVRNTWVGCARPAGEPIRTCWVDDHRPTDEALDRMADRAG